MSVGPLGGIGGSAAGSPLSQAKGSDVDRTQQESSDQQRQVQVERKAESAAGIGETNGEDHETAERDADGRRLWEKPVKPKESSSDDDSASPGSPKNKDTSGQTGNFLDLTG